MPQPAKLSAPVALLAELTHRCPLGCPYCSNPLALDPRGDELATSRLDPRFFGSREAWCSACASLRRRTGGAAGSHRDRRPLRESWPLYQSHHLRHRAHARSRQGTRGCRSRPRAAFDPGFGGGLGRQNRRLQRRLRAKAVGRGMDRGGRSAAHRERRHSPGQYRRAPEKWSSLP